jgi:hypothetical protein
MVVAVRHAVIPMGQPVSKARHLVVAAHLAVATLVRRVAALVVVGVAPAAVVVPVAAVAVAKVAEFRGALLQSYCCHNPI